MRGAAVNPMQALDRSIWRAWAGTDAAMMNLLRAHEDAVLRHVARHNSIVAYHHAHNLYEHPAHMHRQHILRGRL
jgi:hypothetical protein